jgi:lysophospholipase L1-like esterase
MAMLGGHLGNFLLAAGSVAVTLILAEIGFRAAGFTALYDRYSRPEAFWRHDPTLGWSHEPNAHGQFIGPNPFPIEFDARIETNSLGLRGPELDAPRPGERRVLFLGDSFVAGFEVEQEETFATLLERDLERRLGAPVRVINAGVRGYGTDQSYLWYRERGRELGAELVVNFFSPNDFEDNMTLHRPRRLFGKPAFARLESGELELRGTPVPHYEPCAAWALDDNYEPRRMDGPAQRSACFLQMTFADRSALFSAAAILVARYPELFQSLNRFARGERAEPDARRETPDDAAEGRRRLENELATALVQALAAEVHGAGSRFLLVLATHRGERLDLGALGTDGIPVELLLPDVLGHGSGRFRNDGHLNPHGHRAYADALLPIIEPMLLQQPAG